MNNYKNILSFIAMLSLLVTTSCEDNEGGPNTNKFTYNDDISDIVHYNGNFIPQINLSNNAGDQIDLMVFTLNEMASQ